MKTLLKIALFAILIYGAYQGGRFYSAYKLATHIQACTSMERVCELAQRKASNEEVTNATGKAWACAMKQQSVVESWFIPLPETFSNLPPGSLTYKDAERNCEKLQAGRTP
jgi:hypothetical protein